MACTLVFTKNADNSMTITSTDTAGMLLTVSPDTRTVPEMAYNATWRRFIVDFVIGTLYGT